MCILYKLGGLIPYDLLVNHEYIRLFMPLILHVNEYHYLGNIFAECQICYFIERMIGWKYFTFSFIGAGLAGNLLSCYRHPFDIAVGASTAIMGMAAITLAFMI